MKIYIGADEIILWLRKNNKAAGIENIILGRRIIDFMKKLGGKPEKDNFPSIWANDMTDAALARIGLPKTSEQYELDTSLLPAIYEELTTW